MVDTPMGVLCPLKGPIQLSSISFNRPSELYKTIGWKLCTNTGKGSEDTESPSGPESIHDIAQTVHGSMNILEAALD